MQKSKSSSNVGQVFTKGLFKSRSKSNSLADASPDHCHWIPSHDECVWTSSITGRRVKLIDTFLLDLTLVERNCLHTVAQSRIEQMNLGVKIKKPIDTSDQLYSKSAKKRGPILLKRKAKTTSYFDGGKTKDDGKSTTDGLFFGKSLEKGLLNDSRSNRPTSTEIQHGSGRSSRNSISSLVDFSTDNTSSCENLRINFTEDDQIVNSQSQLRTSSDSGSQFEMMLHQIDVDEPNSPPSSINRGSTLKVPKVILACIDHLTKYGLQSTGLFRLSTVSSKTNPVLKDFDTGVITEFDASTCPNDVAAILKKYLRDLPEPLLCESLYRGFLVAQKIRHRKLQIEILSHLIQLLPLAHRDTLYILLNFLAKISAVAYLEEDGQTVHGNRMDSKNLATIFAPNILRKESRRTLTPEEVATEQKEAINVVRVLIDCCDEIFNVPKTVMHDIYELMMDGHSRQLNYLLDRQEDMFVENCDNLSVPSLTQPMKLPATVNQNEENADALTVNSMTSRIYARQDCTHQNAAIGSSNGAVKKRERLSRIKHMEPNNELTYCRWRDKNDTNQHQLMKRTDQSAQNARQQQELYRQQRQQQTRTHSHGTSGIIGTFDTYTNYDNTNMSSGIQINSRRLSSPYVLHDSGILSASLQIPLKVQQNQDLLVPRKDVLNLTVDIPDIPFIEDASENCAGGTGAGGGLNNRYGAQIEGYSIIDNNSNVRSTFDPVTTGSLSLGNTSSVQQQQLQQQHNNNNKKRVEKSSSLFSLSRKNSLNSTKNKCDGPAQINSDNPANKIIQSHVEPDSTPFITNIGGALFRSKTADFERILGQRKDSFNKERSQMMTPAAPTQQQAPTTIIPSLLDRQNVSHTSTSNKSSSSVSSSSNTNNSADNNRRRSGGTIYKRKELISSVQSTRK